MSMRRPNSIAKTFNKSYRKHTGIPAGSANFAEMQIKTSQFMFFITRLTENTNLAASIPPSEQIFNAARVNILLARPRFAELDISAKPKTDVQQQAQLQRSASGMQVQGSEGSG